MIKIENLCKNYGRSTAISDISFLAREGRVTALLGPNGSGKTTTLRVLLGFEKATSGSALIDGARHGDSSKPAHDVGALLDADAYHPQRTGRAHLKYLAASAGIPSSRINEVLEEVELLPAANKRVKTYSLGMKQRLGIAAAMLGNPHVFILDEPVNGLDASGILWLRGLIRKLADDGRTVLICSHLMSEVAEIADDVAVISEGRTIASSSLQDFLQKYGESFTYVEGASESEVATFLATHGFDAFLVEGKRVVTGKRADEISELAADEQIPLTSLAVYSPTLEDAYFKALQESTSDA